MNMDRNKKGCYPYGISENIRNLFVSATFALTWLTHAQAMAQPRSVTSVQNPRHSGGWVTDEIKAFNLNEISRLNGILDSIERRTGAEVAVIVLKTIGDEVPKNFAVKLFNHWGIGKKGIDNGLLILQVADQRSVEIETGYGLEGTLPDITLSRILNETIFPHLKEGRNAQGLTEGVLRIQTILNGEKLVARKPPTMFHTMMHYPDLQLMRILGGLFLLAVFYLLMRFLWLAFRAKDPLELHRATDHGGSSLILLALVVGIPAPIFILGDTDRSLLIGSIGGPLLAIVTFFIFREWRLVVRHRARTCGQCHEEMQMLTEASEDRFLDDNQKVEEKIKSLDYDVWLCRCGEVRIDSYKGWSANKFTKCDKCSAMAMKSVSQTVVKKAKVGGFGQMLEVLVCQGCSHTYQRTFVYKRGSSGGSTGSGGGGAGGRY